MSGAAIMTFLQHRAGARRRRALKIRTTGAGMFKIKLAIFAAVMLASMSVSAAAQQATQAGVGAALPDGKIAVVNTQAFPGGIGELKQKYEAVDKQRSEERRV